MLSDLGVGDKCEMARWDRRDTSELLQRALLSPEVEARDVF